MIFFACYLNWFQKCFHLQTETLNYSLPFHANCMNRFFTHTSQQVSREAISLTMGKNCMYMMCMMMAS